MNGCGYKTSCPIRRISYVYCNDYKNPEECPQYKLFRGLEELSKKVGELEKQVLTTKEKE